MEQLGAWLATGMAVSMSIYVTKDTSYIWIPLVIWALYGVV